MTRESSGLRSRIMRAVKDRDTAPELAIRRMLHRAGYRFRLHRRDLPGCPDLTFPGRRMVLFVHGCFWHGHTCKRGARMPKTNVKYWASKIARNQQRDTKVRRQLRALEWDVLTIWECEIKRPEVLQRRLRRFLGRISTSPAPKR